MGLNKQYKMGEEDKVELLREFFRTMTDFGYTPEFIGGELAYLVRALKQAGESESES